MTKNLSAILCCAVLALLLVAAKPQQPDTGPQPEDFRSYFVASGEGGVRVMIPSVEGINGFVITDFICAGGTVSFFEDDGSGQVQIMRVLTTSSQEAVVVALTTGIVVSPGSTITAQAANVPITLSGYVF